MRLPFLAVVALAALSGQVATAHAQSLSAYPICAVFFDRGGTPRCLFDTHEECLANISGIGGYCIQNQNYSSPRRAH
jgi:hypothetical protein